tara:strand:+ start:677 stop:1051 length:375 start_codon:yes stop_codon:yes gene_type:complete
MARYPQMMIVQRHAHLRARQRSGQPFLGVGQKGRQQGRACVGRSDEAIALGGQPLPQQPDQLLRVSLDRRNADGRNIIKPVVDRGYDSLRIGAGPEMAEGARSVDIAGRRISGRVHGIDMGLRR